MEMAIAILGLVSALVGAAIWFWKKRESTMTRQERIDCAIDARLQREHEIDSAIGAGKKGQDLVNNMVEEDLREQNTTEVRRRAQLRGEILKNGVSNPLVFCLLLPVHYFPSSGCATPPPPLVIPADRLILFLELGKPAPSAGWFIPPARMAEILRALADKTLENDLQNAKGFSP